MLKPKGMSDVKSLRSVETGSLPRGQPGALLQMHRLATEKHRLEREVEMWVRKREQIERRLTEIEQQLHLLRGVDGLPEASKSTKSGPAWREIVLEY